MRLPFFRRPPADQFDLGPDAEVQPPQEDEALPSAEGGERRRSLKPILAVVMLAAGVGVLYLTWGGSSPSLAPSPALLPQGSTPPGRPAAGPVPQLSPSTPSTEPGSSAPPSTIAGPEQPARPDPGRPPAPTFYRPLNEPGQEVASPAFSSIAQMSHQVTLATLESQAAEQRLKKLKAELEAEELRKNPRRLFPQEQRSEAKPALVESALDRLARLPAPPVAPLAPPAAGRPQAPAPTPSPVANPPAMRVRMIELDPKAAYITTGEGPSAGRFRVQEGQQFPDFVVTQITEDGVTIAVQGRGYFYPVGGTVLGAAAPRPGTEAQAPRQ